MEKIRINKYLANAGVASRREIDKWIEEKQIKVNGAFATSGEKVDENDLIEIRGKKVEVNSQSERKVYFLLNKPSSVLSASKDDRGRKTVVDIVRVQERIFPIGRLDFDTEGAILLTNDGELFNKVIHPRTEVFKDYIAEVKGFVDDKSIDKLTNGVQLEDGMTLPAYVTVVDRTRYRSTIKISIREGRNRQIRRMFDAVGHRVEKLQRERIGKISLGELKVGDFRALTKKELEYLHSLGGDESVTKEKENALKSEKKSAYKVEKQKDGRDDKKSYDKKDNKKSYDKRDDKKSYDKKDDKKSHEKRDSKPFEKREDKKTHEKGEKSYSNGEKKYLKSDKKDNKKSYDKKDNKKDDKKHK